MIAFDLPPLWLPPKPAIIRPAEYRATFPMPFFSPTGGETVISTADADGTNIWSNFTCFNRSLAIPNGVTVTKIGIYSTASVTANLKLAERTGVGAYTIGTSESFAHPGGGWADLTLSVPVLTTSADFFAGSYMNGSRSDLTGQLRSFKTGDLSGSQTGFTENSGLTPAMRVTYTS